MKYEVMNNNGTALNVVLRAPRAIFLLIPVFPSGERCHAAYFPTATFAVRVFGSNKVEICIIQSYRTRPLSSALRITFAATKLLKYHRMQDVPFAADANTLSRVSRSFFPY
ncbi:hypothetical protein GWI33_007634 [Rhynchophorus ferrugineus]|uniref:Uncharacterized protein n=1 Tax=Rhynchophorus ferrugineus TaxID=354439 RepID=A0A834MER3_RHYFE|nr:hypothetical protein GWI33_007634 [Rhynchophorus ferrugineus]